MFHGNISEIDNVWMAPEFIQIRLHVSKNHVFWFPEPWQSHVDIVCNAWNKPGFAIREPVTFDFLSVDVIRIWFVEGILSKDL